MFSFLHLFAMDGLIEFAKKISGNPDIEVTATEDSFVFSGKSKAMRKFRASYEETNKLLEVYQSTAENAPTIGGKAPENWAQFLKKLNSKEIKDFCMLGVHSDYPTEKKCTFNFKQDWQMFMVSAYIAGMKRESKFFADQCQILGDQLIERGEGYVTIHYGKLESLLTLPKPVEKRDKTQGGEKVTYTYRKDAFLNRLVAAFSGQFLLECKENYFDLKMIAMPQPNNQPIELEARLLIDVSTSMGPLMGELKTHVKEVITALFDNKPKNVVINLTPVLFNNKVRALDIMRLDQEMPNCDALCAEIKVDGCTDLCKALRGTCLTNGVTFGFTDGKHYVSLTNDSEENEKQSAIEKESFLKEMTEHASSGKEFAYTFLCALGAQADFETLNRLTSALGGHSFQAQNVDEMRKEILGKISVITEPKDLVCIKEILEQAIKAYWVRQEPGIHHVTTITKPSEIRYNNRVSILTEEHMKKLVMQVS